MATGQVSLSLSPHPVTGETAILVSWVVSSTRTIIRTTPMVSARKTAYATPSRVMALCGMTDASCTQSGST